MNFSRLEDPHCPIPDMCSECGEFPAPEDHECEDDGIVKKSIAWLVIPLLVLDGILGWALWTAIKYGGVG